MYCILKENIFQNIWKYFCVSFTCLVSYRTGEIFFSPILQHSIEGSFLELHFERSAIKPAFYFFLHSFDRRPNLKGLLTEFKSSSERVAFFWVIKRNLGSDFFVFCFDLHKLCRLLFLSLLHKSASEFQKLQRKIINI